MPIVSKEQYSINFSQTIIKVRFFILGDAGAHLLVNFQLFPHHIVPIPPSIQSFKNLKKYFIVLLTQNVQFL